MRRLAIQRHVFQIHEPMPDRYADPVSYESYMGRWSRPVAHALLDWVAVPPGRRWLDVGCGTGAVIDVILRRAAPSAVFGLDRSAEFVGHAAERLAGDVRVRVLVGDAQRLPPEIPSDLDAAVSALTLNFVPDSARAVAEMARVSTGLVAAYVWDYAEGMQLLRRFWDAAVALDPAARELDEGVRFALCRPEPLAALFGTVLRDVAVRAIEVPTAFRDFDDLWTPFLGGQAPAPGYVATLDDDRRDALRERLRAMFPAGPIALTARAWAARGYAGR